MADLITCKYCGIVERGHRCPYKTYRKKAYDTDADKFRQTRRWANKSKEIREKAKYLCEVCMDGKYHTVNQFNFKNLEVHHIEPLSENYNRRLDNLNLTVLCQQHHKMAERGEIPRNYLFELAEKRERNETN